MKPGDRVVIEPYVYCGECYPCTNGRTNCCENLKVRGVHVDGAKTIEQLGEDILEYCIRAASGEVTPKAVRLNQDDFIPWKQGVSL